jgi:hypothetical protein
MDKKAALAYIARFVENSSVLSIQSTKYELRDLFLDRLGDKLFESSEKKIIALARELYIAHVVSLYTRYTSFHLLKRGLKGEEMKDLLKEQVVLDKKFDVYYDVVDRKLTDSNIDKHMKEDGLKNYKAILSKMIPENSPTAIKIVERKKREAAKEAKRKEAEKKVKTTKKTSTKKSSPKKTVKKTSTKTTKKAGSKKEAPVKKATKKEDTKKKTSSKKSCSSHTVVELKSLAKDKGHTGYSKLKKDELCKLLKIK